MMASKYFMAFIGNFLNPASGHAVSRLRFKTISQQKACWKIRSTELEQANKEKGKIPVPGTTRTGRNWATFGESTV